jgi:hypothetical protein
LKGALVIPRQGFAGFHIAPERTDLLRRFSKTNAVGKAALHCHPPPTFGISRQKFAISRQETPKCFVGAS